MLLHRYIFIHLHLGSIFKIIVTILIILATKETPYKKYYNAEYSYARQDKNLSMVIKWVNVTQEKIQGKVWYLKNKWFTYPYVIQQIIHLVI